MSQALSYFNLTVAFTVFIAGVYMVATEHNLLRKLMGINLCGAGVLLLAILTGFVRRGQQLADGTVAGTNTVVPAMQWLAVAGIVAITAITAVGLALARSHKRVFGTMDLDEKRNGVKQAPPQSTPNATEDRR